MSRPAARCRRCGKPVKLRADETVMPHDDYALRRCTGTGLPAAGEPPCPPSCEPVGYICWPPDVPRPGEAHRSAVACGREDHQREADAWVTAGTGHHGVFRPFIRN